MEEKGVDQYKRDHDERRGGQRQVQGVSRTELDDGEEYPGTPTKAPEGHSEEHRQPAPGEPGGPSVGHYPMPGEDGGAPLDENEHRKEETHRQEAKRDYKPPNA